MWKRNDYEVVGSIKYFNSEQFKKDEQNKKDKNKALVTTTTCLASGLCIYFLGFDGTALAAGTGIDAGAEKIYDKILLVGKWIIIVKGAIDTINNTAQGDFASAKRSFLSYLIIYLILKAFPWAMNELDTIFKEMV
jgi:hypothetical protein